MAVFSYSFTVLTKSIVDVFNITKDEVRVKFLEPVSLIYLDNIENYIFTPSTAKVTKVLVPAKTGSVNYIDLVVSSLEFDKDYLITIKNVHTANNIGLGDQVAKLRTTVTKSSQIINHLPSMYNTAVESNLRHIIIAVGLSDEIIGGYRE